MRGGDITRSIVLVMLAAAAIAAVALVGLRSNGGPDVASAHVTGSPHMEIDLVKDGTGWCNPVDATASRAADNTEYQVAICLTDSPAPPAGFQFEVVYDPALNTCTNVTTIPGDSLDDNPDANAGTTTFSTPDLGTGWDCSDYDLSEPLCDLGGSMGTAYMSCMSAAGTLTLPFGSGVSAPLAVLNLKAANVGVDNLALQNAAVFDASVTQILACTTPSSACVGATVNVNINDWTPTPGGVPPTGTPGAGVTPGAGATPAPSGPEATAAAVAQGTPLSALTPPPAGTTTPGAKKTPSGSPTAQPSATPGEEKGEGEGGGANAAVIAVIVIGAVVVVGGAGWFAWRRLRLR